MPALSSSPPTPMMSFDQFAKSPFVCDIGDHKMLVVPRFLRKDWKVWAAEEDKRRRDEALDQFGDDKEARARFMAFYVIPPTSPTELRNRLNTYEGQEYVVRKCLEKLRHPQDITKPLFNEDEINEFFEYNDQREIEVMAAELACFRQKPVMPPNASAGTKSEGDRDKNKNKGVADDEDELDTMLPDTEEPNQHPSRGGNQAQSTTLSPA